MTLARNILQDFGGGGDGNNDGSGEEEADGNPED